MLYTVYGHELENGDFSSSHFLKCTHALLSLHASFPDFFFKKEMCELILSVSSLQAEELSHLDGETSVEKDEGW